MFSIVDSLEQQKLGFGSFRRSEVGFKYYYGRTDERNDQVPEKCPLFAARFSSMYNYRDVIAIASEDGYVIVRNSSLSSSSSKFLGTSYSLRAHNNAVFDLTWAEGAARIVTASGDNSAALWDVSGSCVFRLMTFVGHTRSVRSVAASPSDCNIFATGSRDGSVMLWDCRQCSREITRLYPDNTISRCYSTNVVRGKFKPVESITSVTFIDDNSLANCIAGQGTICIWDMRRTYRGTKRQPAPKYALNHPYKEQMKGYSCLAVSPCRRRLYASCIDSTIYCFDIGTFSQKILSEYKEHTTSSFYVKHSVSPCGQYLMSGSSDEKAYIWHIGNSHPIATLEGHSGEVTSAIWAPYMPLKMATASEDGNYLLWTINPKDKYAEEDQPRGSCNVFQSHKRNTKPILTCRFNCKKVVETNENHHHTKSPIKSPIKNCCKKARLDSTTDESAFSPTLGLPNYVMDGSSPNMLTRSGKKVRDEDWLTKLRRGTSPGSNGSTQRRSTPRVSRAKGSLLKFFCNQPRRSKTIAKNSDNTLQNDLTHGNTSLSCDNAPQLPTR